LIEIDDGVEAYRRADGTTAFGVEALPQSSRAVARPTPS
jgi:hypothetical protein